MMSHVTALPTTKSRLLSTIGATKLPTLLRMSLFGITYQERGKYRHTAADELAYPSQAILARVLVDNPNLSLPVEFPTVAEFYHAVSVIEPQMRRQSLRLGMENSFVSRAIRTGDLPSAAPWTLMALALNPANGSVEDVWRMVEHTALAEATARGIADLDEFGRWPR